MRRHIPSLDTLITVPRNVCPDDVEVRQFLADEMLNFTRNPVGPRQLFHEVNLQFGEQRCASVCYWTN
jgi:hypothetical protein